jgi:protein-S-isoprenylcysteine O-methyltransferase Ste14
MPERVAGRTSFRLVGIEAHQERRLIMSLMPAFQIGLWNAWILMVLLLAAGMAPLYINYERVEKRCEGEPDASELDRTTRISHVITHMVIMPFTLVYSILVPLKLDAYWLLAGLPVYLVGVFFALMFSVSFSTAPLGEPLSKGVWAISRNPGYFGYFLGLVGIGLAGASWVFLLCALVWIVAWHFGVIEEERILLEKYGDAYQEYMNRTPRWIGFPKTK